MKRCFSSVVEDEANDDYDGPRSKRELLRNNFRSFLIEKAVEEIIYDKISISAICQTTGLPYYDVNEKVNNYIKINDLLIPTKKKLTDEPQKLKIEDIKKRKCVYMTPEDEKDLFEHILNLYTIGYFKTKVDLLTSASLIVNAKQNTDSKISILNPGTVWCSNFIDQYPNISEIISKQKQIVEDNHDIEYEKRLKKVINYNKIESNRFCYIFDEIFIELEGKLPKLLTNIQRKSNFTAATDNSIVKVMFCISSIEWEEDQGSKGRAKPRFFEAPCSREANKMNKKDVTIQLNRLFKRYMLESIAQRHIYTPSLCFYDPHLTYIDISIIKELHSRHLYLFPLPPHQENKAQCTTPLLQDFQQIFNTTIQAEKHMNSWPNVKRLCENIFNETVNRSDKMKEIIEEWELDKFLY